MFGRKEYRVWTEIFKPEYRVWAEGISCLDGNNFHPRLMGLSVSEKERSKKRCLFIEKERKRKFFKFFDFRPSLTVKD